MATVSASQPISTITPPHSSDGRTSWDYAVPIDHENAVLSDTRTTNTELLNNSAAYDGRGYLTQQRNGTSRRTNTMESGRTAKSTHSADSRQPGTLKRKTSNLSAFGDAAQAEPYRNNSTAVDHKRKHTNADNAELDDSKWIHRDKLAQIESMELEAAGFRVPRKTMSRATSSRSSSRHRVEKYAESPQLEVAYGEEASGAFGAAYEERQRTMSPSRVDEEIATNDLSFELRTPEEVAAERDAMTKQSPRPGASRIPVKKASALPVPTSSTDRDLPSSSGRAGNNGWGAVSDGLEGSNLVPDEYVLDARDQTSYEDEPSTPPASNSAHQAPFQHSPPQARVPGQTNPSSGTRKPSTSATRKTSAAAQSRNTSASSPSKRPGTSSGRPSTSHMVAPEGDPPWITNMYKPDPRLPPDQQILPTHAKRMAQEQWEKEGKTGTVYDRDFRLMNDIQPQQPQQPLTNRTEQKLSLNLRPASNENLLDGEQKREEMPVWPLSSHLQNRASAATSGGRPGTSGTDHGGYSIMPSINSPKHPPGSPNPAMPSPKPVEVVRMQDPESGPEYQETEKKKGGCGCCVVM